MKKWMLFISLFTVLIACEKDRFQNAVIQEELRNPTTEIDRVFVNDDLRLTFTEDSSFFVKAAAIEGHLGFIETHFETSTLFASTSGGGIPGAYKEVFIGGYPIAFIKHDGIGLVKGSPNAKQIELYQNGLGLMSLNFQCESIELTVGNSGPVNLRGTVERLSIVQNNAGTVRCGELQADIGKVVNNGSGDVYVNTTNVLSIIINGSGNVYYTSGVEQLIIEENGSGSAIEIL